MYNYRGYNASTGVPSPDSVKADAVFVVKYLREVRGVTRLLVHGESIGGIAACHVARNLGADMLVCDRTLASLDAVASRLLGHWAGLGLRLIVNWKTNVVNDYLQCNCPKIIIQVSSLVVFMLFVFFLILF